MGMRRCLAQLLVAATLPSQASGVLFGGGWWGEERGAGEVGGGFLVFCCSLLELQGRSAMVFSPSSKKMKEAKWKRRIDRRNKSKIRKMGGVEGRKETTRAAAAAAAASDAPLSDFDSALA